MRGTYNPSRRNRNIGTAKSGYGQDNKLVIPGRFNDFLVFWERLYDFDVVKKDIRDKVLTFIIEKTKKDYFYSCTIDDVVHLLNMIPEDDWDGIGLFVFRQPKKKEVILEPVWGRLGYNIEVNDYKGPAVIIEAVTYKKPIIWNNSLTPDKVDELERLREDGHKITQTNRNYKIELTKESARATQLFRTLLHEIGHWVHWNNYVIKPSQNGNDFNELEEKYFNLPKNEKEIFAHKYVERIRTDLIINRQIPFESQNS